MSPVRRCQHRGQKGALGRAQGSGIAVKIGPGRSLDAMQAGTKLHHIEIGLQDALLGQALLQPPGKDDLLQFAGQGLVARQKKIARQLHGHRAGTAPGAAGLQVQDERSADGRHGEAGVTVETGILLHQHRRHGGGTDRRQGRPAGAGLAGGAPAQASLRVPDGVAKRATVNAMRRPGYGCGTAAVLHLDGKDGALQVVTVHLNPGLAADAADQFKTAGRSQQLFRHRMEHLVTILLRQRQARRHLIIRRGPVQARGIHLHPGPGLMPHGLQRPQAAVPRSPHTLQLQFPIHPGHRCLVQQA